MFEGCPYIYEKKKGYRLGAIPGLAAIESSLDGVTGITYSRPSGKYSLATARRNLAIHLKTLLDRYNNNISCP